jgi:ribosomal protein S18 acetylase RimI-like enzyme
MDEKVDGKRIDVLANILTSAFFDDPFYNYIFPDKSNRHNKLFWLMEKLVLYGNKYGKIGITNEPINGVIIWLKPSSPMLSIRGLIEVGILRMPVIFGPRGTNKLIRISHEWEYLQKREPKRHWYLLAIGVDPAKQGRGIGSSLMMPILLEADQSKLSCYLETMTIKDIQFYNRHGFEIVHKGMINESIPYWTMRRDPKEI